MSSGCFSPSCMIKLDLSQSGVTVTGLGIKKMDSSGFSLGYTSKRNKHL